MFSNYQQKLLINEIYDVISIERLSKNDVLENFSLTFPQMEQRFLSFLYNKDILKYISKEIFEEPDKYYLQSSGLYLDDFREIFQYYELHKYKYSTYKIIQYSEQSDIFNMFEITCMDKTSTPTFSTHWITIEHKKRVYAVSSKTLSNFEIKQTFDDKCLQYIE